MFLCLQEGITFYCVPPKGSPLHGVPEVRMFELFCPLIKEEKLVDIANTELPGQLVDRIISAVPGPDDGTVMVTAMMRMPPGIHTVQAAASAAGFLDIQFPDGSTAVINFNDKPPSAAEAATHAIGKSASDWTRVGLFCASWFLMCSFLQRLPTSSVYVTVAGTVVSVIIDSA